MRKLKLYLAGPDVFLRDATDVGRWKQAQCRALGHEGLYPLDNHLPKDAVAIFAANRALMDCADAGLFNLSPFRGPSADAGTIFELGYMAAQGKPLFGYSNERASYAERVARTHGPTVKQDGVLHDRDGYMIERFAQSENLMISKAIRASGGLFVAIAESGEPKLASYRAFVTCLTAIGNI